MSDVSVDDVVSNVEEITKPLLESKNLIYRHHAADEVLFARADHDKVQQIVLNLLSNAIKFTPSGGRVDVDCNTDKSRIRIRVSDTGIGIPPESLQTVFEPFVQVDN